MKITKSELVQLIKEEYGKKVKADKLVGRLHEIESQIKNLLKEDEEPLEEVEAGPLTHTKSTGWAGDGGDTKYGTKFEKIGTHLKEEDEIDDEIEIIGTDEPTDEIGADDLDVDGIGTDDLDGIDADEIETDEIDLRGIVDDLVTALETMVKDEVSVAVDGGEEGIEGTESIDGIEDAEGIEGIEDVEGIENAEDVELEGCEMKQEEEQVVVEPTEEVPAIQEAAEVVEENAEEPQDGHSLATDESPDSPQKKQAEVSEPFIEDQDVIKEEKFLKVKDGTILSEELIRMRRLTGLITD